MDANWEDIMSEGEEDTKPGPWYKLTDLITGSLGASPHHSEFFRGRKKSGMIVGLFNKDTRSRKAKDISLHEQNLVEQKFVNDRINDKDFAISEEVAENLGLAASLSLS